MKILKMIDDLINHLVASSRELPQMLERMTDDELENIYSNIRELEDEVKDTKRLIEEEIGYREERG